MITIDYYHDLRPLNRSEWCGDIAIVKEFDNKYLLFLFDGLGHGYEADVAAKRALSYVEENYKQPIDLLIKGIHTYIQGTRGGVVMICILDPTTGILEYSGIGNITARIKGVSNKKLVSREGVVGYGEIRPRIEKEKMKKGETLIMYSDGVKEFFSFYDCKEIWREDSEYVCKQILQRYGKKEDDQSCIVLQFK